MKSKTIRHFAFKPDQQRLEFVCPCKGSLTDEAMCIHNGVEIAFPSALDCFPVAFILRNIGLHATIPQQFSCCSRVEAAIRVENGTFVVQSTPFHITKEVLELLFKLITVVMVPCYHSCCGYNQAILVRHWQDITRFRFLSPLIGDFFAPFLAALWLPSRLSSDKFNSPLMLTILASKRRWRLPSWLHFRK